MIAPGAPEPALAQWAVHRALWHRRDDWRSPLGAPSAEGLPLFATLEPTHAST